MGKVNPQLCEAFSHFQNLLRTMLEIVTIALTALLLLLWIHNRRQKFHVLQKLGYPGPKPTSTFLGNFADLLYQGPSGSTEINLEILHDWHKKYGRIFGYFRGTTPRIVVTDLDILRQVFVRQSDVFTNRNDCPRDFHSLTGLKDDRWKFVRRIVTPTFSALKLKNMMGLMESCSNTLLEVLECERQQGEVEIFNLFQLLTMDVVFKCALALNIDCQRSKNGLISHVKAFFNEPINYFTKFLIMFPGCTEFVEKYVANLITSKGKSSEVLVENLKTVLDLRRKMDQTSKHAYCDILQLLIEAADGKHENKTQQKSDQISPAVLKNRKLLTDKEIIDNALVVLEAGFETTSNLLAYAVYLLAKHQDIQQRARKEVDIVFADKASVSYEDVMQLHYLEQICMESLRMYPPVTGFLTRHCKQTITINGWTIPKGCEVEAPVPVLHKDPEYWPDPEKFDPERFSADKKDERQQLAFCAFGMGPRKCIGDRFSLMEAKMSLGKLLHKYIFKPSEKYSHGYLPTASRLFLMNPCEGVWVKVEPRLISL